MKILVVEDDFASRLILQKVLSPYGEVHVAINGAEAVAACRAAENEGDPYKLICLDIMMPEMDGQEALTMIRQIEQEYGYNPGEGAKIIMTTALEDGQNVMAAFREQCDGYLVKPIDRRKLIAHLGEFGLAA